MLMATAFFRTIILYLLLIAGLRLTGKRQIGELEPIELVLTMLLSDLASVPMQDFDSPLINGVVPILTLLALTTLLSYISFRSGRFRSLICGEPAIVVRYGKLQQRAMRHNRMTVDELLEELRGQGVTDLKDVQYAVLETSGQVSVLLRSQAQPVTPRCPSYPKARCISGAGSNSGDKVPRVQFICFLQINSEAAGAMG
jgi:uncharacterized membrane protein YcaP (DUF421 family)